MDINQNSIIGELVAENYKYASVFKKSGIDFCCNGNRSISNACEQKKIDVDRLLNELNSAAQSIADTSDADFKTWPLDLMTDYIEKKHHRFVEQKIQEILPFLNKVVRVHGERHPELIEVGQLFTASASELSNHMKKEEMILFPYIRQMMDSSLSVSNLKAPFGTVQNPVNMMQEEHNTEGERFRKIASLTNNYTPPEDACNTYRVTFSLLKEFEEDLHKHIHLENNILFPKAIALEASFN